MKVNSICKRIGIADVSFNHEIFHITDDSRECIENSIFFAIKGNTVDGNEKIEDAIFNGAVTIVTDTKQHEHIGINYIYSSNVKKLLAMFLSVYYRNITKHLKIIGVIGTNGKTTTSTLIYNFLKYNKKNAMLIGSNGCICDGIHNIHNNTTPRAVELYSYFSLAKKKNIRYVVMEISSISVSESRIFDINFHTLIFTNFSEDHLDYHKTMDRYLFAKLVPFYKMSKKSNVILNYDDTVADIIAKHTNAKIYSYGINHISKYKANNIYNLETGVEFEFDKHRFKSNLIGGFNVYNILPLFAICDIYGIPKDSIKEYLLDFKQVDGRMNLIDIRNRHIIIDYAHTEVAVENVIKEIEKIANKDIYVVLGCGGNREKEKRSKIGSILSNSTCKLIITSDNPRYERPSDIIDDILSGINRDVVVIENRSDAIIYALNNMNEDDYLLILGKGVENYIEIKGHKNKYNDMDIIKDWQRDN